MIKKIFDPPVTGDHKLGTGAVDEKEFKAV
jgi:hypothetical protein